jgi:hypothetical protein
LIPDTPKSGDSLFARVNNVVISENGRAGRAAVAEAKRLGFSATLLTTFLPGEARQVGRDECERFGLRLLLEVLMLPNQPTSSTLIHDTPVGILMWNSSSMGSFWVCQLGFSRRKGRRGCPAHHQP